MRGIGIRNAAKRALRMVHKPPADKTLTRLIKFRGSTFFVSPRNKVESRLLSGQYDDAHFAFIDRVVHPGSICMDIGANIGVYSVALSRIVGPTGQVHAFEPVDHIRSRAVRNLRANGARNTTMIPAALGSSLGEIEMLQVREGQFRGGTSSIHATENMTKMGLNAFERRTVPIKTIDTYVAAVNIPHLDFVKIDIEGHELECLRGGRETLKSMSPMVLFEHSQPRLKHLSISESDFATLFEEIGYEAFELVSDGFDLALRPYDFSGRPLVGRDLLALKHE